MTTKRLALGAGPGRARRLRHGEEQLTRPDYTQVDQQRVKRLVVVTQPLPDGKQSLGELWSLIARQYVNQNRDFLVKQNVVQTSPPPTPRSRRCAPRASRACSCSRHR